MENPDGAKSPKPRQSSPHNWTLEVCMIVLSISCLLAVIILLPLFDNKPISKWRFDLSFNTIVSILGAISRASLAFAIGSCISQGKWNWFKQRVDNVAMFDRFDEASRGPWGSMLLLFRVRFKHWVALGALCTVVLLGFEPLLQAGITYYGKEIVLENSDAVAGIGRTQRLDVGRVSLGSFPRRWEVPGGVVDLRILEMEYDFQPLAAMWTGFSNLSSVESRKPSFTCSSGNCTWPAYASIAVCNSCADISHAIIKSTGRIPGDEDDETIITKPVKNQGAVISNATVPYTKYEIRQLGMNISNYNGGEPIHSYPGLLNTTLTAKTAMNPGKTISFQDFKTLIGSFAVMETSRDFRDGRVPWQDAKVTATECALYFCTNVYESEVAQGILKETTIESYATRNMDSFLPLDPELAKDFKAFDKYTNYTLSIGDEDALRSDLQMTIPSDAEFAKTHEEEDYLRFNISQSTALTVISLFRDFSAIPGAASANKQLVFPDKDMTQVQQPRVILSLGTSPNITATFENAAAIMSKWIRDSSNSSEHEKGTVYSWETHIRIHWAFLSLPVTTFVFGCVFCLLSVLETRKLKLQPWKGSSLATLAVGLDYESQQRLKRAETLSMMNEYVRDTKVRLNDSTLGTELKAVD